MFDLEQCRLRERFHGQSERARFHRREWDCRSKRAPSLQRQALGKYLGSVYVKTFAARVRQRERSGRLSGSQLGRERRRGDIQKHRETQVYPREWPLWRRALIARERGCNLYARWSRDSHRLCREQQNGFSGDRSSQGRDARNQQSPARPGTIEVRQRLHFDSVCLEKSGHRSTGACAQWKSNCEL